MNRLMFKKIFTLMYKALTENGWQEKSMYGNDFRFRINTVNDHFFSIWFVGCRCHFIDASTSNPKTFGQIDELNNLEVVYNDYDLVKQLLGADTEEMGYDHNTMVNNFYTVLDATQIDWVSVIQGWLSSEQLVSDTFERHCTIQASKEFKRKLLELVSY